ncbi:uncharacterized protein [Rutidosis leptorrhynchoides]|uniref:uncharacterized protein n=1 Tax=Rutidosis leptorrhynchoides TaxID=125765 RepID=UPI003A99F411
MLVHVIDKIISPVQSAFIYGRQILDGPLILNEIMSWYKKNNCKMLLFKVDFEKAYDSVNWDYLCFMLSSLGFGSKWCGWILGYDVIIFSDWNRQELRHIIRILEIFYLVSGLRINLAKSNVFGIGVNVGRFPTNYLGIPIGANMKHVSIWESLVDKFQARLSSWKASLISSVGRLTLIKSVMGSIGIYYFSMFKCPETIIKRLEAI